MVNQATQADIIALRREIAEMRGHVVKYRIALGNDDPSLAALELDRMRTGHPWQNLTIPAGASGTAQWREVTDGHVQVRVALTWVAPPAVAHLAGLPSIAVPWSDDSISVAHSGLITLTKPTSPFNGIYSIPLF